ncbi:MAG: choice-of-anchor D domain-containing protein [Terriglobales bacterium]
MRSFLPVLIIFVVASLLFCLAPASAWAQQLECNPCSYAFGNVAVGASSTYSIELTNTGSAALSITYKSRGGSTVFWFGTFTLPVEVKAGASLELPVIFKPTASGSFTAVMTLKSTAENSPLSIDFSGTGVVKGSAAPALGVTPATLSFGSVTVGSSASLQATLTASNTAVTISSDASTSSEFVLSGLTLPATIAAGKSVAVTIQFTPNASGAASGQAGFTSNATGSPTVAKLTGTGVAQSSNYVSLSWAAASGSPVGYNVFRGTAKAGPFDQINTALNASTSYTDDTVVAGTTYYYVTTAVNAEGAESAYSNVAEAVVPN